MITGQCERLFLIIHVYDSILYASKRGFTYPKYVWIMRDVYDDNWWTNAVDKNVVNCTDTELETFLDKMILFRSFPLPENDTVITDAGIVSLRLTFTEAFPSMSCTMYACMGQLPNIYNYY